MKCQQAEQWLLLKDTGELSFLGRLRLEQHLAGCPACRAYRDYLAQAMAVARRNLPAADPGLHALAAIRAAARAAPPVRGETSPEWRVAFWQPVLAAAALFLVCLGGWYWLGGGRGTPEAATVAWAPPAGKPDSPANGNGDVWMMIIADETVVTEPLSDLAARQDITPLDRDLLLLEGLAI